MASESILKGPEAYFDNKNLPSLLSICRMGGRAGHEERLAHLL